MTKTLCIIVVIVLCNTICQSASIAEQKPAVKTELRNKRTAAKIGDLREKLAKLKKLLDDVDTDSTAEQTTPAPEQPKSAESHSQEQKSLKGENTLSPKDILLLKSLKLALEGMHKEETVDKKQVLQTVVYRLLSDLDLALRNGITVEDIIKYLYETEQAARQTQKRSRIEDEEKQLKALLNHEPSPRD